MRLTPGPVGERCRRSCVKPGNGGKPTGFVRHGLPGLLFMLERAGQIELPPVTYKRHNPLAHRARPAPVLLDQTLIEGKLKDRD